MSKNKRNATPPATPSDSPQGAAPAAKRKTVPGYRFTRDVVADGLEFKAGSSVIAGKLPEGTVTSLVGTGWLTPAEVTTE